MARRRSTDRLVAQAQQAIEHNEPEKARILLEAAARQDNTDPRPWLMLATISTSPRERHVLLAQADRLKTTPSASPPGPLRQPVAPATAAAAAVAYPAPRGSRRSGNMMTRTLLAVLVLVAMAGLAYLFAQSRVGEALVQDTVRPVSATGEPIMMIAAVDDVDASPTVAVTTTAASNDAFIPAGAASATDEPTEEPPLLPAKEVASSGQSLATWTVTAEPTPTLAPTVTPTSTPEPSPTPVPPPPGSPRPYGVGEAEKWIDVNLTTQTLIAYEGDTPVLTTLISSGAWQYQTVTGEFRTYLKYEVQLMNGYLLGYDYYTPDVPSVMYFYEDYAIHGAYWHNNFGTPVSHGCINAPPAEAAWLFNWAPVGTFVTVHY